MTVERALTGNQPPAAKPGVEMVAPVAVVLAEDRICQPGMASEPGPASSDPVRSAASERAARGRGGPAVEASCARTMVAARAATDTGRKRLILPSLRKLARLRKSRVDGIC